MALRKVGDDVWEVRYQVRRRFRRKARALWFQKNLQSTVAEAERRHRTAADPERPCCSIRERLEEFLSDSAAGLGRKPCAWRTVQRHRTRLETFDRAFRSVPVDCVTRSMLERWIKRRLRKVSRDTVNVDLGSLRAFARWAQRKKYAPAVLELMLVDRLHERGKLAGTNRKPPKDLGMEAMLANIEAIEAVRDDVGLFLRGVMLFGLRPAGVAALRRDDVVLPAGEQPGKLHCKGLKGRPDRDIPIESGSSHERWALQCLGMGAALKAMEPRMPLVPRRMGGKGRRRNGWTSPALSVILFRICRSLKIDFTAYQIRHTCIAWMQANGFSLEEIAVYADHAKITTQAVYAHPRMRKGMKAFNRMGEVMERRHLA